MPTRMFSPSRLIHSWLSVERFLFHGGWKFLRANLDVNLSADLRVRRGHIRHADAPVQARRKRAACHFPNVLAIAKNGVVRPRWRTFLLHPERNQLFARAEFFCLQQRITTDEVWFG